MADCVSADAIMQGLAAYSAAVHGSDLVSNVMVSSAVDARGMESAQVGSWGSTSSRSHFK